MNPAIRKLFRSKGVSPGLSVLRHKVGRVHRHRQRQRRGLTLVDAMMSLTICALLLSAISAAFSASCQAINANDQFTRSAQSCSVTIEQLMSDVRKADAVQVTATSVDVIRADGSEWVYTYSATLRNITLTRVGDATSHVLASRVTSCSLVADIQPDPKTQINRVTRVTATMTVITGTNSVTLSGSAAPRRALVY